MFSFARVPRLGARQIHTMPSLLCAGGIGLTMLAASFDAGGYVSATAAMEACEAQFASGVPASRVAALARGFNLPGWLDNPTPRRPDTSVLATLHARGFTHIRLPVDAELVIEELNGANDVARKLAELDIALQTLTQLGFAVTIDVHPASRFGRLHIAEPSRALTILESLWRVLARRY